MKTTLFLDFDGVVNLFNSRSTNLSKVEVERFTLRYKQSIVDKLNEMHDNGINIVWLTDWQLDEGYLEKLEEAIGFRKFGRTPAPKREDMEIRQFDSTSPVWWKKEAVRSYLASEDISKAVWIDDSHFRSSGGESNFWWCWINPNQGVTTDQLDKLTKWLSE